MEAEELVYVEIEKLSTDIPPSMMGWRDGALGPGPS